jgi:transposase
VRALPQRLQTIAAAHPDKRLQVYWQDESRFGQQGTITNVWAKQGSRPAAIRQTEYEYLWVLGAVCPETGHAEGLLSPQLNTKMVNEFLVQFAKSLPAEVHAVMIWDGAGFHASKRLCAPDNVSIITLPPYSPELNPIENLWHYLKSHFWSNRAYDDYDALEQAAVDAWRKAALDSELMKSVCAVPYLERADSS